MELICYVSAEAARAAAAGKGPDESLVALQCADWFSFGLDDVSVWDESTLRRLCFRLAGGRVAAAAESASPGAIEPEAERKEVFEAMLGLDSVNMLGYNRRAYLGHLWTGCSTDLTVVGIMRRVRRILSACEEASDRREAVGACFDGIFVFGAPASELRPLTNALAKLGIKPPRGSTFRLATKTRPRLA